MCYAEFEHPQFHFSDNLEKVSRFRWLPDVETRKLHIYTGRTILVAVSGNWILSILPLEERHLLNQHLQEVFRSQRDNLLAYGDEAEFVYFQGVVSLLVSMEKIENLKSD